MKWGDVLGIIGILFAASAFPLLFDSHRSIIAGVLVAIGVMALLLRWWFYQPEFTLLMVEKILSIGNATGRTAILVRSLNGKVTQKSLSEFWCHNIGADGAIVNIRIDGEPPQKTLKEAGDIHVGKRFARPLRRGEEFSLQLSYELVDSFVKRTGALIHVVENRTKKLRMVVILPRERPAKSAHASFRYGGQMPKKLPDPLSRGLNAGERIEIEVKNPKLGAEYCLDWSW